MLNNRIGAHSSARDGRRVCSLNAGRSSVPTRAAGPTQKGGVGESASSPRDSTPLAGWDVVTGTNNYCLCKGGDCVE